MDIENNNEMKTKKRIIKTKSDYNRTYYEKNKDRIIQQGCKKVICDLCEKTLTINHIKDHKNGTQCKKRQQRNKYEKWLKTQEEK